MSLVSLVGALTISVTQKTLNKFLTLFIAMASGTLIGGAFFHMIPHALNKSSQNLQVMSLVVAGFLFMYAFELLVHWHHCNHDQQKQTKPQGIMILFADAIHNFVGGVGIGAGFIADVKLGISMWLIAILHEIPQEIGDFSILINSGLDKKKALTLNFLSSLTFLLGMLLVFGLNTQIDISFLIPIAAGNFIYIAASDLIPEIKEHPKISQAAYHLLALSLGLILLLIPYLYEHKH
jgi:zinc and cadmium transporter